MEGGLLHHGLGSVFHGLGVSLFILGRAWPTFPCVLVFALPFFGLLALGRVWLVGLFITLSLYLGF